MLGTTGARNNSSLSSAVIDNIVSSSESKSGGKIDVLRSNMFVINAGLFALVHVKQFTLC